MDSDPSLSDVEKRQKIARIQQDGESRLVNNRDKWSKYTDVHDSNRESTQRQAALNSATTKVLSDYRDYSFSPEDKKIISDSIASGATPEEVKLQIESSINDGLLKPKAQSPEEESEGVFNYIKSRIDERNATQSDNQSDVQKGNHALSDDSQNPPSIEQIVLSDEIPIKEKLKIIESLDVSEEEKNRLKERANYSGMYRAGGALGEAMDKPLPLESFENRGFVPRQFGLTDKG